MAPASRATESSGPLPGVQVGRQAGLRTGSDRPVAQEVIRPSEQPALQIWRKRIARGLGTVAIDVGSARGYGAEGRKILLRDGAAGVDEQVVLECFERTDGVQRILAIPLAGLPEIEIFGIAVAEPQLGATALAINRDAWRDAGDQIAGLVRRRRQKHVVGQGLLNRNRRRYLPVRCLRRNEGSAQKHGQKRAQACSPTTITAPAERASVVRRSWHPPVIDFRSPSPSIPLKHRLNHMKNHSRNHTRNRSHTRIHNHPGCFHAPG